MKNTHKLNITLNALVLLLLALFFLAGTMMWSQSHQYQNHSYMHQDSSYGQFNSMTWNKAGQ